MRILIIISIILSCSNFGYAQKQGNQNSDKNLVVIKVQNSELSINPEVGARIVSLKYLGKELLSSQAVHSENFGSTLWTDPQSDWGWPPYDTLDALPYQIRKRKNEWNFTSKKDKRSGFQILKKIKPSQKDSSFNITYFIKNISNSKKSVGAWEVTRVLPGGLSLFPSAPDSSIMADSNLPGVKKIGQIIWFVYDFEKIKSHAKLFAMGSEGWMAHVVDDIAFIKTFDDVPTPEIVNGQGEIEIYVNGERKYTEIENHSSHKILKPGETLSYKVKWLVRKLPSNINKFEGSIQLVEFIKSQL
ncbi:MAG: DUF4380 domain-containing protein [Bacteroidales bacterium]|nr:DUF4380 domain-containing protein [Bacteroidales bacterium]